MDAFLKREPANNGKLPKQQDKNNDNGLATKQQMAVPEKPKFVPWVEKYRPSKVEEVSHQKEAVSALSQSVQSGQVPHLLFYGPPGTGKTSTILAMAKEMFGSTFYRQRVLELNASDERGINVVREKIKKFAQRKLAAHPDGADRCPPLQIIILDEADSMTNDAQAALRRIIEAYSTNTRFCIICNYISKIIDPLASRCVKFRFSPIDESAQFSRLSFICENEGIALENKQVLERLIQISEGDLRRSTNTLQTCSTFSKGKKLSANQVESVSGVVPTKVIADIDFKMQARGISYSEIQSMATDLIMEGFDVQQLLLQLLDHFLASKKLGDLKKAKISEIIANTDFNFIQGGNEELNLLYALSNIAQIMKQSS